MLGFCNHAATAVLLVIDRKRFLPFYLWSDSLPLLDDFLAYAKGSERQPVVLFDGVATLARLSADHQTALRELKAKSLVFDSFNALKTLGDRLTIVDVEQERDGVWKGVELKPAHINNLVGSDRADYDPAVVQIAQTMHRATTTREVEEETRYLTPTGRMVLKEGMLAKLARLERKPVKGSLHQLLLEVCQNDAEVDAVLRYALFRADRRELRGVLGPTKTRRVVKFLKGRRRPLLRAVLWFKRFGRPRFIAKHLGVPICDVRLATAYLSDTPEGKGVSDDDR